jgi:membrane-bound lytic murein transglycosylase D
MSENNFLTDTMKKIYTLITVLLLTFPKAGASAEIDTIIIRSDIESEKISTDLDSLVNTWYVKLALQNNPEVTSNDTSIVKLSDTEYEERLRNINSIINLPYNSIIKNHIEVYTVKQRDKFAAVLGLMDYYFPIIEDIFDFYGLPSELKYMAVIESALNPNAVNSHSGATGLWQFMYSTGRMYGLTINSVVDERRNPVLSTNASAKYL